MDEPWVSYGSSGLLEYGILVTSVSDRVDAIDKSAIGHAPMKVTSDERGSSISIGWADR